MKMLATAFCSLLELGVAGWLPELLPLQSTDRHRGFPASNPHYPPSTTVQAACFSQGFVPCLSPLCCFFFPPTPSALSA